MTDLSELLYDHFKRPRYAGRVANPSGVGRAENRACGDVVEFSARVEQGRVVDIAFLSQGCSALIGASSYLAQRIRGGEAAQAFKWEVDELMRDVGEVRPTRRHGISVALRALRDALGPVESSAD